MVIEFEAALRCNASPCTYCSCPGKPVEARTFIVRHPDGPFTSADQAYNHGWVMARQVYGSEHTVVLRTREVTEWAENDDETSGALERMRTRARNHAAMLGE